MATPTSSATATATPTPAPEQSTWEAHQPLFLGIILIVVHALYHGYLFWRVKTAPQTTVLGTTRSVRRIWSAELMVGGVQQITAVHTLRNWNMSNTMMATAAVAITFGMTSWVTALSKASVNDLIGFLGIAASLDPYKIITLIYVYMFAFFAFTQSMRYLNHFEFVITPPLTDADVRYLSGESPVEERMEKTITTIRKVKPNPISASRILNLGGAWYTVGMRCVYFSFPVIMWFFSDWAFFVAGLLLVPLLYWLDFREKDVKLAQHRMD